MKNTNNISFELIKNYLSDNRIEYESSISNSEIFSNLNSLKNSTNKDLSFFVSNTSLNYLSNTKAKACILERKNIKFLPKDTQALIVREPYKTFALLSNLFREPIISNGIISQFSIINNKVKIEENIQINNFVEIKENCEIGKNVIIDSNCTIGPNVKIGDNTYIMSNSVIMDSVIGNNCVIKPNAVIGGAGFGFEPSSKTRIQHFGNVIIEDNCNIGSNTTIDKAVFDSTIISKNCFIDNLVQIAHNVKIGNGTIIASQCGIAGSSSIGNNVTIGGKSGISGHLKIGDNVTIAAKSGVTKNIKDNSVIAGFPAVDIKKWKLANIKLYKL